MTMVRRLAEQLRADHDEIGFSVRLRSVLRSNGEVCLQDSAGDRDARVWVDLDGSWRAESWLESGHNGDEFDNRPHVVSEDHVRKLLENALIETSRVIVSREFKTREQLIAEGVSQRLRWIKGL